MHNSPETKTVLLDSHRNYAAPQTAPPKSHWKRWSSPTHTQSSHPNSIHHHINPRTQSSMPCQNSQPKHVNGIANAQNVQLFNNCDMYWLNVVDIYAAPQTALKPMVICLTCLELNARERLQFNLYNHQTNKIKNVVQCCSGAHCYSNSVCSTECDEKRCLSWPLPPQDRIRWQGKYRMRKNK